jgi:energy-coupling factor transport system substrate-specific component
MSDEMGSVSGRSAAWSTRDIVVTAALAVATGISFIVFDWVYIVGQGLFGNIAQALLEGLWLLGALLVPYVVRRPGSAIFGELVASLVEASFNPFGITVLLAGVIEGIGAEIVFLLTGYRRFTWAVMALAGAVDALVFFVLWWSWRGGFVAIGAGGVALKQAPAIVAISLVVEVLSGAAAGCLAKVIGDALVPTGVLDGFPVAERRTKVA